MQISPYANGLVESAERKALKYLFPYTYDKQYIFFRFNKEDEDYREQVEQFKKLYNSNDNILRLAAWNSLHYVSLNKLDENEFSNEELAFIKENAECTENLVYAFRNNNKAIKTSRLILKPQISVEEINKYEEHLINDGDFTLYTGRKLNKNNLPLFTDIARSYFFCVYEKSSNNMVGLVGLYGYDKERKTAEAQWYIFKPYRNKGYAKEAITALAERAFSGKLFEMRETAWRYKFRKHYAKIDLIQANIREINTASNKTAESCGFKYLYTVNRYFLVEGGEPENGKHYELTPETLKKPDC